ncbi:5'-AMP-activated serine/threonine-protein kinase catalytic subunit alpha-like [Oppia nitens]|uniref:5'-AMP-activated serine/threonine-protein kinase catalytic subunit alpha-like n=1 Tax=Oppia nitens TaxID=1686743 RepID=UPI0023D9E29A|nr:5'-AMP-activated serine/threonine-protein kinase catalytic subunit alpha-like [Oppia nitens]
MANNRFIKLSIKTLKPEVHDFWFQMSLKVKTIKDLKSEISAHLAKYYRLVIASYQLDLFTNGGQLNDYLSSEIFTTHKDIEIRRKLSVGLTKTEEIKIIQLDDEVDTNSSHQLIVKQEISTEVIVKNPINLSQIFTTSNEMIESDDSNDVFGVSQQNKVLDDSKPLMTNNYIVRSQELVNNYLDDISDNELEINNLNDNRLVVENVDNSKVSEDNNSFYHKNNEIIQLDNEMDTNVSQEVFTNDNTNRSDNNNQQNNSEVNLNNELTDDNQTVSSMTSYMNRSDELENNDLNDNRVVIENLDNSMVSSNGNSDYLKNNGETIRLEEQTYNSDICGTIGDKEVVINIDDSSEDSDYENSGQSSNKYNEKEDNGSNDIEFIGIYCPIKMQYLNPSDQFIVQQYYRRKKSYKCQVCDQTFGRNCQLQRHINFVHKQLQCPYYGCNARFSTKYWLTRHQKLVHKNNKLIKRQLLICGQKCCGKKFYQINTYALHQQLVHKDIGFSCVQTQTQY